MWRVRRGESSIGPARRRHRARGSAAAHPSGAGGTIRDLVRPKWRNGRRERSQTPLSASSCGFESHLRHHHQGRIAVSWLTARCLEALARPLPRLIVACRSSGHGHCSPGGVHRFRGPPYPLPRARLGRGPCCTVRVATATPACAPRPGCPTADRRPAVVGYPTDSHMAGARCRMAAAAALTLRAAGVPGRDITILGGEEGDDRLDAHGLRQRRPARLPVSSRHAMDGSSNGDLSRLSRGTGRVW